MDKQILQGMINQIEYNLEKANVAYQDGDYEEGDRFIRNAACIMRDLSNYRRGLVDGDEARYIEWA